MEDREQPNLVLNEPVDECVRKSVQKGPPRSAVNRLILKGVECYSVDRGPNIIEKARSQSG